MATRFIESAFRQQVIPGATADRIPFNVTEYNELTTPFVEATVWTAGGTIIENVRAQAPLGEVWSFLGWSIVFTPLLVTDTAGGDLTRLGKIIAGLTFTKPTPTLHDPVPAQGVYEQPWQSPMIPLPPNTFGLDTVWDGLTDTAGPTGDLVLPPQVPFPPLYSAAPGLTQVVHNYALPVPTQIYPGESMQMGIWITPSQADGMALAVTGASYTVVVDDGQPQVTTWGRDFGMELAH